jgi:hypothetical protein
LTGTFGQKKQFVIRRCFCLFGHRRRALSDEERVGQRIQRDPRGEINGLLVQMMAIENLARAGLPKEGRELLDLAVAKEETAAIRARGGRLTEFIPRPSAVDDAACKHDIWLVKDQA